MYNQPLPIGYVETQHSWVGGGRSVVETSVPAVMQQIAEEMALSNPTLRFYGSRLERSEDGAGVEHFTLYVGYAPAVPSSEPLDPSNLNDAPASNIGDPARDNMIGAKEQKF